MDKILTHILAILNDSLLTWEDKHDLIFAKRYAGAVLGFCTEPQFNIDYYDPDGEAEEDVTAFCDAITANRLVRAAKSMRWTPPA